MLTKLILKYLNLNKDMFCVRFIQVCKKIDLSMSNDFFVYLNSKALWITKDIKESIIKLYFENHNDISSLYDQVQY